MGEGLYMVLRVLYSSGRDTAKRVREARAARRLPKFLVSKGSDDLGAGDEAETNERQQQHPAPGKLVLSVCLGGGALLW